MKMAADKKRHDALDQSRDVIAIQAHAADSHLTINQSDRQILRRLAGAVAELAARPVEEEKQKLWARHNALESTRPMVFCDPENGWKEIIPPDQIECENQLARQWEMHLRKEIFWGTQMNDDYTIQPYIDISHVHEPLDWGLKETRIGGENDGSFTWISPLKTQADLEKLHPPEIRIDDDATERLRSVADEIFRDLMIVRVKTLWWWSLGMTRLLAELRGLEQLMYDVYDNPDMLHSIMTILKNGTLAMLDELEEDGLLSHNTDGTYVGSGGLGWTNELPQPDFSSNVRCIDMWGFAESQETVGISPDTFSEFIFPYQLPILDRFGLNCYGCCEPLDLRWHIINKIPNLRRVSVSPWADKEKIAQMLEDKYIYSLKPNPVDLAMDSVDERRIRNELREVLAITQNCHVEIIMKDNHTIRKDPQRVIRWVQIVREESEKSS
jgi:hypothetical protein